MGEISFRKMRWRGVRRRVRSGLQSGLRHCRLLDRLVSNNIIGIEIAELICRGHKLCKWITPFEFAIKPWMNGDIL